MVSSYNYRLSGYASRESPAVTLLTHGGPRDPPRDPECFRSSPVCCPASSVHQTRLRDELQTQQGHVSRDDNS